MATLPRLVFSASTNWVDVTAPTFTSASIPAAGTSISLLFSEAVKFGAGSNGGFAITLSGGACTLTYASGANSNTLVYTTSRTVNSGETCSAFTYTQPTNGVEDIAGNDLATIASGANRHTSVTNNSTVGSTPAPQPDLVWWKFTEGSGTTVADDSTVGTNTGTISGATWVTGRSGSGYALSFDGTDDFLKSTNNLTFGVKKCTVCAWVNLASYANNDAMLWEHSVSQSSNQNTFNAIPNSSNGTFDFAYRGNGYRAERITRPSTGWHHIAIYYDVEVTTAGDCKIWVDGVEQSTTTYVNTNSSSGSNIATLPTYFMSRGGTSLFLAGTLDDVRIYKSELTTEQIEAVMDEQA